MDQASLLREMMKNKKRGVKAPFAILGVSALKNAEVLEEIIKGIEKNRKEKIYRIENSKEIEERSFEETRGELILNIEKLVKEDEDEVRKEVIRMVEKKEKASEQIVIKAGFGVDYSTINATMLVDSLIFVMKNEQESVNELGKYIKIMKQLAKKQTISVYVLEEGDKGTNAEERMNKIQEQIWDAYNYYIEVVGLKNEKKEIKKENFEKFEKIATENEKVSISLQNRFF